MVTGKSVILALAVVIGATIVAFLYWPHDKRAIGKQLTLLEVKGSKEPTEQPVETLLKSKQIAGLFRDPCRFTVAASDFSGEYDRKQIMDRITMIRSSWSRMRVRFYDISIDFPEEKTAGLIMTVRLNGMNGNDALADTQEVSATLRKIEGDWLFTSVRIEEVLQR